MLRILYEKRRESKILAFERGKRGYMKTLLLISFLATTLLADAPRVLKREFLSDQPPLASDKPDDENARVIRRVYRKIEQPETAIAKQSGFGVFIGGGADFVYRKREIEIKTKNNGDVIKVGKRLESANGANYTINDDSDEIAPSVEIGFLGGERFYYGAKLDLLEDFFEVSAFGGAKFEQASIASFVPFLQAAIGAGYEDFHSGVEPNNLSLSARIGCERSFLSENLTLNLSVFYRYRFWQKLEKHYGDEYWRDREIGGGIGARYAFSL
ncbi:MAG: hypothetical protein LBO72_03720 [Helicobacteraceae bacterium]|nr:hypothetical protein [Helicobacteraceae bacterium]